MKKSPLLITAFVSGACALQGSVLIDWGGTGMASADTNFSFPSPSDNGTTRTWEYSDSTAFVASGGNYTGPAIYGALQSENATDGPTNITNALIDDRGGSNDDRITTLLNSATDGDIIQGLLFFKKSDFANLSSIPNLTFDSSSSATLNVIGNQGSGTNRGPRIAVLDGSSWYVSDSVYQGFSGTLTIGDLSTESFASYDPTGAPLDPTPGSFGTAGSAFTDIQAVGYYFSNGTPTSGQAGFSISGFEISAVPEPSTFGLIAGAFALGLMALRRRRG